MMEDTRGIESLDTILKKVPGIGAILIGEGDLSQELGYPRQYEHPEVLKWMAQGGRHLQEEQRRRSAIRTSTPATVERIISEGYRFLMVAPVRSYAPLDKGLKLAGRG